MKTFYLFCLAFFSIAAYADPVLKETEILASYLQTNGISYQYWSGFTRHTPGPNPTENDPNTYVFLSYPDPADDETMAIFFEFSLGSGLVQEPDMHLAVGLRGPEPAQSGLPLAETVTRGRGLAIGNLGSYHGGDCVNGSQGFFIEHFTYQIFQDDHKWLTTCKKITMPKNIKYRADVHVSKDHVMVAVWKKIYHYLFAPPDYQLLAYNECYMDFGPWREEWQCPEYEDEEDLIDFDHVFGNAFITVTGNTAERTWNLYNVFIAHWDT